MGYLQYTDLGKNSDSIILISMSRDLHCDTRVRRSEDLALNPDFILGLEIDELGFSKAVTAAPVGA